MRGIVSLRKHGEKDLPDIDDVGSKFVVRHSNGNGNMRGDQSF